MYALELSLAGRVGNYSDVGLTGNPKLGLVWRPWADLKLRGSWGTSFRAPALTEEFSQQQIVPSFLPRGADQVLTLIEVGGDPGLRPETATTWSAGADYAPAKLRGLTLSLNGFGIDYEDRIGQPAYEGLSNALTNPDYAPFVTEVTPASSPGDLALIQSLIARSTSSAVSLFPPPPPTPPSSTPATSTPRA